MDNLLVDGDMLADNNGGVQMISGIEELVQRALIRLTVKKGCFAYDTELGSGLHNLDIHRIDDFTLLSIVSEALRGIEEIQVTGVEKTVNEKEKILYLTVYLRALGQDAILEVNNGIWR